MSQPPPPPEQPRHDIYYETPERKSSTAGLVKLMYIFNFIMAGLDVLFGLMLLVAAIFLPALIERLSAGAAGGGAPPPKFLLSAIYGGEAVVSVGVGIVKAIGAYKTMKRSRGAWGWALAGAICGCLQLWCSIMCVMPLAVSVFSFVVLMRQDTRAYIPGDQPPLPGL